MKLLSIVLTLLGMAGITFGVSMLSLPAAVIVGGLFLVLIALDIAR